MPAGSNAAVSGSDATPQVHPGLANAVPAATFPKRASSAVPPRPGPNTPYMPSTRTRVPDRVNAPRCEATAGMLASQLEHPAATNHTSTGRPRSEARLSRRWSSSVSVPPGAAAPGPPQAAPAAGGGAPLAAASPPRAAPNPRTTASAPILAAFPVRRGLPWPAGRAAGSACTASTSALTGAVRPQLLRQYRLIRRYRRPLSLWSRRAIALPTSVLLRGQVGSPAFPHARPARQGGGGAARQQPAGGPPAAAGLADDHGGAAADGRPGMRAGTHAGPLARCAPEPAWLRLRRRRGPQRPAAGPAACRRGALGGTAAIGARPA